MPNRNQKGPLNEVPMTGRKLGLCNQNTEKNEHNEFGAGRGLRNGNGRKNGRRQFQRSPRHQRFE